MKTLSKKSIRAGILAMLAASLCFVSCKADPETEYVQVEKPRDTTAPRAIAADSITATAGNGAVLLKWTASSDQDFYGTEITFTPAAANVAQPIVVKGSAGQESSVYVTPLENGTEYTFSLVALDKSLNAAEKTTKKASPVDSSDKTPPASVTGLVATNLDGSISLEWTDPADSDLFGIEISWTPDTSSRAIAEMDAKTILVAPNTQYVEITNLVNGNEYTFTAKAMDTSGNKSPAATKSITPAVIEKALMAIELTPSSTELTNQNVDVTAKVTTTVPVKSVKYASGSLTASYFGANGTALTANDQGTYKFTAEESGTYTVFAQDTDGRRETKEITISNIDKAAPASVSDFAAVYESDEKTITLSWKEPADSDYDKVEISCGDEAVATVQKGTTTYVIANVAADGIEKVYKAVTFDKIGNSDDASAATTSVTPLAEAIVGKISLNRTHLAKDDADKSISVTVSGEKFHWITDNDKLEVKVMNGDVVKATVEAATIDKENNTATAIINAPETESSVKGTEYTVRVVIAEKDSGKTASFVVSDPTAITKFALETKRSATNAACTAAVTITGTNLDLSDYKINFYGSLGTLFKEFNVDKTVFDLSQADEAEKSFTFAIPVPEVNDVYTVELVYGTKTFAEKRTLVVSEGANTPLTAETPVGTKFKLEGVDYNYYVISNRLSSGSSRIIKTDNNFVNAQIEKFAVNKFVRDFLAEFGITEYVMAWAPSECVKNPNATSANDNVEFNDYFYILNSKLKKLARFRQQWSASSIMRNLVSRNVEGYADIDTNDKHAMSEAFNKISEEDLRTKYEPNRYDVETYPDDLTNKTSVSRLYYYDSNGEVSLTKENLEQQIIKKRNSFKTYTVSDGVEKTIAPIVYKNKPKDKTFEYSLDLNGEWYKLMLRNQDEEKRIQIQATGASTTTVKNNAERVFYGRVDMRFYKTSKKVPWIAIEARGEDVPADKRFNYKLGNVQLSGDNPVFLDAIVKIKDVNNDDKIVQINGSDTYTLKEAFESLYFRDYIRVSDETTVLNGVTVPAKIYIRTKFMETSAAAFLNRDFLDVTLVPDTSFEEGIVYREINCTSENYLETVPANFTTYVDHLQEIFDGTYTKTSTIFTE